MTYRNYPVPYPRRYAAPYALLAGLVCGVVGAVGCLIQGTAPTPTVPLSFWKDGGYWDFRTLPGFEFDTVVTPVASSIGANSLTPANSPVINDTAIGGNRSLVFLSATQQYFRADALAGAITAGIPWTVACRYRSTAQAIQILWSAASSASSTNNYFTVSQTALNVLQITSSSTGSGVLVSTGTTDLQYNEHVVIVSSDGTNLVVTIDGVPETMSSHTIDPNPIVTNRFAVGAQFSTALAAVSSLDIQLFADSALFMNAASQAVFAAQLLTGDLILPKSQSKQFMDVGDSITITSLNTLQGAGIREYKDQWIIDNRLSLNSIGQFVNGTIPNRECCGQGGADIATIKSNALAALSFPSAKPSAILLLWGTNNISAAGIVPTALAAFRSNLQLLWNAAVAKNPLVRIQLATITPINTSVTPASANALLFNIGLQTPTTGEFDVFAANNPGALLSAVDYAAAVGGAWSAPMFSPDNVHPNELGCQTIGAAQVLADGLFLRSLSATIRPLAVRIASPSTGASFASNVATNIQVNATRYPSTVQIKKLDGTVLGSATMTKLQGTFAWTPGAGNEGPQTLIAVVTDTLDSTIATSAGVAVTVTPAAYSPASEGNLGWWGDMQNVSSYTITGGTTVTSLKNVQTGVAAITGTAAPGYSAAGANGHPCLSLLAASSQNLICGVSADAAFTSAINGGSRTEFHVLSVNPTSAAGYFFTLANNSPTSAAEVFGAISSAYRTYHTSDANVTVSLNAPAVPDTALHIVRVRIDATANLAYISVDGGAESSGAFAQGSATNTRWGIGSTVGAAPGSFAGGLYAEGLVYTDLKAIGAGSACERVQTYLKAKWGTP